MERNCTVIEKILHSFSNKKVLVTGASGLLGSHLVESLLVAGAKVGALYLDSSPNSYFEKKELHKKVDNFNLDINDQLKVDYCVQTWEPEFVFHLAAVTQVKVGYSDPSLTFRTNVIGTINILESIRKISNSIENIVIASSDKAYGSSQELPYLEDYPLQAHGPYDTSKACTDLVSQSYAITYNLPISIIRAGNIYGPGDLNFSRLIPGIILSLLKSQKPVLRSDGSPVRDYVYVKDVAAAYLYAAASKSKVAKESSIFNVSSGEHLSVDDMYSRICNLIVGKYVKPTYLKSNYPEIQDQILDNSKITRSLGWEPGNNLESNLVETIFWYREFFNNV